MQDSDTKCVPIGASVLQKCVVPFAILILKPAFRADLRMSAEGPPFTTIEVNCAEVLAAFFGMSVTACSLFAGVTAGGVGSLFEGVSAGGVGLTCGCPDCAAGESSVLGCCARTAMTTKNEVKTNDARAVRCDISLASLFVLLVEEDLQPKGLFLIGGHYPLLDIVERHLVTIKSHLSREIDASRWDAISVTQAARLVPAGR
ncbi:MAG TPA: hypothetical protein VGD54_16540 [Steroidobacteraceae bacterium]